MSHRAKPFYEQDTLPRERGEIVGRLRRKRWEDKSAAIRRAVRYDWYRVGLVLDWSARFWIFREPQP